MPITIPDASKVIVVLEIEGVLDPTVFYSPASLWSHNNVNWSWQRLHYPYGAQRHIWSNYGLIKCLADLDAHFAFLTKYSFDPEFLDWYLDVTSIEDLLPYTVIDCPIISADHNTCGKLSSLVNWLDDDEDLAQSPLLWIDPNLREFDFRFLEGRTQFQSFAAGLTPSSMEGISSRTIKNIKDLIEENSPILYLPF